MPTWAATRLQWLGWQRANLSAASNGWVKVNATQGFIGALVKPYREEYLQDNTAQSPPLDKDFLEVK